MTMKNAPLAADSETQCECCGRTHRKLFLVDGHRVGATCGKTITLFKLYPNRNSFIWNGCESQYNKALALLGAAVDAAVESGLITEANSFLSVAR